MNRKSILWTCVVLLVCVGVAAAETVPFVLSGELRLRNENDNRDFNSGTGYKTYNLMRTRLGINVCPANDLRVFVQMQDSRVAGLESTPPTIPGMQQESTLDLHQGFFQVDNFGWQGFGLKAGRMEVRYDNERLLGVTDWSNVPRAFDGGVLTLGKSRLNVQAMYANLVERDTPVVGSPGQNSDATLQAGCGTVTVTPDASDDLQVVVDLQVVNVHDKGLPSVDDTRKLLTFGGRLHGKAVARFEYSAEGAYQTGSQQTSPSSEIDVGAYMFAGAVGMSFGSEVRPMRVGVGYDYLSGDEDGTSDGKFATFNTLFGDDHTYYGLMDVTPVLSLTTVSALSPNAGLQDLHLNARGTVWQNEENVFSVGGELHNFRLAQAGTGDSGVGNEVDLHVTWAYRERFVPTFGFCAFVPGDAVGPDADNSYWAYLQGTVSF